MFNIIYSTVLIEIVKMCEQNNMIKIPKCFQITKIFIIQIITFEIKEKTFKNMLWKGTKSPEVKILYLAMSDIFE